MMKLRKIGLISLILFCVLQCSKIGMLHFFKATYQEGRLEFYPKEKNTYSIYAFDEIESDVPMPKLYIGKEDYIVSSQRGTSEAVKGLGVSQTYPLFEPLQIVKGSFWMEQAESEGRNVAVISKQLAGKLYNTYEAVGEVLQIEDSFYQVVGIYEPAKDGFNMLADTGEEVIYFPITSTQGKTLEIKTISFFNPDETKQMNITGGILYRAHDGAKRLESITLVSINILCIVLVIFWIKESLDTLFFKEPCSTKTKVYTLGFYGLLIFVTILFIMRPIYIPSEILPPYNIFDLSCYWQYFRAQIHMHNQMLVLSETPFEKIYWMLTKWSLEITVIQGILCLPIASEVMHFLHGVPSKIGGLEIHNHDII